MGTRISSFEYKDKATGTDETGAIYKLGRAAKSKSPIVGPDGESLPKNLCRRIRYRHLQKSNRQCFQFFTNNTSCDFLQEVLFI